MKRSFFIRILRYNNWLFSHHLKLLAKINYYFLRLIFSCDLPPSVMIDSGIFPHYALGVVIHPRTILGKNFKIYQNVTIGYRKNMGPPKIGDNVIIGAGAVIIGNIVIGNNVQI